MDDEVRYLAAVVTHDNDTKAETWLKAVLETARSAEFTDHSGFVDQLSARAELDRSDVTAFAENFRGHEDYAFRAVTLLKEGSDELSALVSAYHDEIARRVDPTRQEVVAADQSAAAGGWVPASEEEYWRWNGHENAWEFWEDGRFVLKKTDAHVLDRYTGEWKQIDPPVGEMQPGDDAFMVDIVDPVFEELRELFPDATAAEISEAIGAALTGVSSRA